MNKKQRDLLRRWHSYDAKLFEIHPLLFGQRHEEKRYVEYIISNPMGKYSLIYDDGEDERGGKKIVVFEGLDFRTMGELCWKFKIGRDDLIGLN